MGPESLMKGNAEKMATRPRSWPFVPKHWAVCSSCHARHPKRAERCHVLFFLLLLGVDRLEDVMWLEFDSKRGVHWEVLNPFSLHGSYDFCDRKHFPRANQDLTAALLSTAREVSWGWQVVTSYK